MSVGLGPNFRPLGLSFTAVPPTRPMSQRRRAKPSPPRNPKRPACGARLCRHGRVIAIALVMPFTCWELAGVLSAPRALAAVSATPGTAKCGVGSNTPPPMTLTATSFVLCWSYGSLAQDHKAPIAESSPVVANLDSEGPAVVVGDRTGDLYAYHLSDGTAVAGWPVYDGGTPIDSAPSVAALGGSSLESVFVGTGNAKYPDVGGYAAYEPGGQQLWHTAVQDPTTDSRPAYGVQASLTVADLQDGTDVFAGSLDQESYALDATTGSVLTGWPFFSADSVFSTAAAGDLYGNGQEELVVGGASTAGSAMGQSYSNGGHVRVLDAQGALIYDYDTNQEVVSSPAVGGFLANGATGIAVGTGTYYPGTTDTDTVKAFTTRLGLVWSDTLDGPTSSSPALADVEGNGQLDVVEGSETGRLTGSVWVLDGANGSTVWEVPAVSRIIGSVVAADLSGRGYQDLLVPTVHGVEVLDGRSGSEVTVLGPRLGFQNSPLVTEDPNGTVGITIAGYNGDNVGVVQHYEIPGSNGALAVGAGSWPMFHHDPSLSGVSSALPDLGTVSPTALTAQAGNAEVSLSWVAPTGAGTSSVTGYNVYEGTAPGHEPGTPINAATPVAGSNYLVTGLSNGQSYYFEVTAINSAGEGAPSTEASATPELAPVAPGPPAVPPIAITPPSTTTTTVATTTPTSAPTTTTRPPSSATSVPVPQISIVSSETKVMNGHLPVKLSCRVGTCSGTVTVILVKGHQAVVLAGATYKFLAAGRTDVVQLRVTGAGSARFSGGKTVKDRCIATAHGGLPAIKMIRIS